MEAVKLDREDGVREEIKHGNSIQSLFKIKKPQADAGLRFTSENRHKAMVEAQK